MPYPHLARPVAIPTEDNFLLNPEPENEHVGVDEEGMYIDVEGNQQFNVGPLVGHDEKVDEALDESDSEDDSDSDSDYDEDEGDGMVQDNVPPSNPEVVYGKDDPPMIVGSTYPNMAAFKLALASHAIRHEFEYNIEKSDPGRYMVYCAGRIDGCRWRIHASTMDDQVTVKSTAGRRKQTRYKGAAEGGTSNKGRHECSICHDYGHHWYTCKDGDPEDIAAMLADGGLPKRRKKSAVQASTETNIVPVPSAPRMIFPDLPVIALAIKK
ncbi:unnamed protein product [Urochloa humidicola]